MNKVPIISKKELEKKSVDRGTTDVAYCNNRIVVAWKDNKAVYMASNKHTAETSTTCKRFCRIKKSSIQVSTIPYHKTLIKKPE